jgi:hypothetical protein
MTDAERIAGLLRLRASEVDVALTYAEAYDRAWEGTFDIGALMAILSDVRREEREACIAAIDAEQREWAGDHPRSALDCARERIVNRGTQ